MENRMKLFAQHGFLIYESDGFFLVKVPTALDDARAFRLRDGVFIERFKFKTYEEAFAHACECLGVGNKCRFAVQARFNDGLGWRVHNLPNVYSNYYCVAKLLATKVAQDYFATHEDLKDVTKFEVRIRPHRLD